MRYKNIFWKTFPRYHEEKFSKKEKCVSRDDLTSDFLLQLSECSEQFIVFISRTHGDTQTVVA